MDENFVTNLLRQELRIREGLLNEVTKSLDDTRNRLSITTSKQDYISCKNSIDSLDLSRRELRGEISALRQALKVLEREGKT